MSPQKKEYEIIPDSELSVDALLNSEEVLYTESEMKFFEKTPWINYLVTGKIPEKTEAFFSDAGYSAFVTVITLDNSLKNILSVKKFEDIKKKDLKFEKKAIALNTLTNFLNLPFSDLDFNYPIRDLYACKMRGFTIADYCAGKLQENHLAIDAKTKESDEQKFPELQKYIKKLRPTLAGIKGSYIDYIKSGKKTTLPRDIDLIMIVDQLTEKKYYKFIRTSEKVNDIEIRPLLIPSEHVNGYSYFDFDINEQTSFLYGEKQIIGRKNKDLLMFSNGNSGLKKTREYVADEEKLEELYNSGFMQNKVQSAVRQPERMYKFLNENDFAHLVNEPPKRSISFKEKLSISEIRRLIAEASVEQSMMIRTFSEYVDKIYAELKYSSVNELEN